MDEKNNGQKADQEDNGYPQATVREVNGGLVLDDPVALAMIKAIGKHNCRVTLKNNLDRVEHFIKRAEELKKSSAEVVITIINVDDVHGGPLAESMMPNTNWQEFRDHGEIPFARGLALRSGIQEYIEIFDKEAAEKLRGMNELAIVVIDNQVVEIFSAKKETSKSFTFDRDELNHGSLLNPAEDCLLKFLELAKHEDSESFLGINGEVFIADKNSTKEDAIFLLNLKVRGLSKIGAKHNQFFGKEFKIKTADRLSRKTKKLLAKNKQVLINVLTKTDEIDFDNIDKVAKHTCAFGEALTNCFGTARHEKNSFMAKMANHNFFPDLYGNQLKINMSHEEKCSLVITYILTNLMCFNCVYIDADRVPFLLK